MASAILTMWVNPIYAASGTKITSVDIEIEADIEVGSFVGDEMIDVIVDSEKYSFDDYEVLNNEFEWLEELTPQIAITLSAKDGYYFALTKASSVQLKGGTYVSGKKENDSENLIITVNLTPLTESVGEVTEVVLREDGRATWPEAQGAGSYELRLYRGGVGVGMVYQETTELYYDYTKELKRAGEYYVKVRAINRINKENKSDWVESQWITITEAIAENIRNGVTTSTEMKQGAWSNDEYGWKYTYLDTNLDAVGVAVIDELWYFFDSLGYMQTGWVEINGYSYYFDTVDGTMLVNTTTPDGYRVGADGVWIPDSEVVAVSDSH